LYWHPRHQPQTGQLRGTQIAKSSNEIIYSYYYWCSMMNYPLNLQKYVNIIRQDHSCMLRPPNSYGRNMFTNDLTRLSSITIRRHPHITTISVIKRNLGQINFYTKIQDNVLAWDLNPILPEWQYIRPLISKNFTNRRNFHFCNLCINDKE
jgi:hypothetical protein